MWQKYTAVKNDVVIMVKYISCRKINDKDKLIDTIVDMKHNNESFCVVTSEAGIPYGILHLEDAVNIKDCNLPEQTEYLVKDVMRYDFSTTVNNADCQDLFSKNNMGSVTYPVVVVDTDGYYQGVITEKLMVEILCARMQFVKGILNNIEEGIIAVDKDKRISFINEAWKEIHAINSNELMGSDISENFPESGISMDSMTNELKKPLHLKYSDATVLPTYKKIIGEKNENLGAMAIVRDFSKINEFYIGINQMSDSNMLFNSVFNYLLEYVFYVDKNLKIKYANRNVSNEFDLGAGKQLSVKSISELVREPFSKDKAVTIHKELEISHNGDSKIYNLVGIPTVDTYMHVAGMVIVLQDITRIRKLKNEVNKHEKLLEFYKQQTVKVPNDMIIKSTAYQTVISTALKVAETDASVLIEGENGVGKELVAKLIHSNSLRRDKPFIPINCGAIPEALWESEMFGYEEGSFTGAKKGGKAGLFEMADGGTIFLDEIGEMSLSAQVKLLRFLQNMEIQKLGRNDLKRVDVRIIAATNKDLEKMVEKEEFREDLYYRLNVISLKVPPLRERISEIKPMAEQFLIDFNNRYRKDVAITNDAIRMLEQETWPGNVRQLRNVIEQAVIMCDKVIREYDLPINSNMSEEYPIETDGTMLSLNDTWNIPARTAELEKKLIISALRECGNNKSKAIEKLNISRKTFYKKLKEYKIDSV